MREVDGDPSEQIARLDLQIEELAELIERCRKVMLAGKIAIAAGGALLLAILAGAISFHPIAMVAAITAVLGGIVLLGSNRSTAEQSATELKAADAHRAELIGQLELKLVSEAGGP